MIKKIAVLLVAVQFAFPVFLTVSNAKKHSDIMEKGTEYFFVAESFYIDSYSDERKSYLNVNIKNKDSDIRYNERYGVIETDSDGFSYIAGSSDELSESSAVLDDVLFTSFDISKTYAEKLVSRNEYLNWFESDKKGTFTAGGEQFAAYAVAKIYKGDIIFTDFVIDGESIL